MLLEEQYQQIIDEAYENYSKAYEKDNSVGLTALVKMVDGRSLHRKPSKDMFVAMCTHDKTFSERWVLKIEERSLTEEERLDLVPNKNVITEAVDSFVNFQQRTVKDFLDELEVPTKLITITYKNKTIEVYE